MHGQPLTIGGQHKNIRLAQQVLLGISRDPADVADIGGEGGYFALQAFHLAIAADGEADGMSLPDKHFTGLQQIKNALSCADEPQKRHAHQIPLRMRRCRPENRQGNAVGHHHAARTGEEVLHACGPALRKTDDQVGDFEEMPHPLLPGGRKPCVLLQKQRAVQVDDDLWPEEPHEPEKKIFALGARKVAAVDMHDVDTPAGKDQQGLEKAQQRHGELEGLGAVFMAGHEQESEASGQGGCLQVSEHSGYSAHAIIHPTSLA